MTVKEVKLRHLPTNQNLTAIHIFRFHESTSCNGQIIRVLKDEGWRYKEAYMPIRRALACVFEGLKKENIEDTIDDEFLILDVIF